MARTAAPKKSTPSAKKKPLTYAQAGVDIDAGDEVVERIKPIVRRTYSPRVMGLHGAFAGMFRLDSNRAFKKNYKNPVLVACTDGVGTKVKLAAEFKIYNTVGIDCVAMNVNDLLCVGATPAAMLDYIAVQSTDPEVFAQIGRGLAEGARLGEVSIVGGETAVVPDMLRGVAEGDVLA